MDHRAINHVQVISSIMASVAQVARLIRCGIQEDYHANLFAHQDTVMS